MYGTCLVHVWCMYGTHRYIVHGACNCILCVCTVRVFVNVRFLLTSLVLSQLCTMLSHIFSHLTEQFFLLLSNIIMLIDRLKVNHNTMVQI